MNSSQWFERSQKVTPGGVHSPVRSLRGVHSNPTYFSKATGPYLYDVEGKKYVDFCMSFGPHILGHCPEVVTHRLREEIDKATSFGACHPMEVQLSEKILQAYPFLDRVRLINSGTEAVMTAIRIARGATGRDKILKFDGCYHGHVDSMLAQAGSGVAELSESSSKGVASNQVQDTLVTPFCDFNAINKAFDSHKDQIAAVILEPIPANNGLYVPTRDHLEKIQRLAKANGALVIFDEVITGFRVGLSGASGLFDLKPDLVTLGKIIGGGLPLAAVAGKADLMDHLAPLGQVYQAGTLSGNPLATAAGYSVLDELFSSNPYAQLEETTSNFVERLKHILSKQAPVRIPTIGSLFWIDFGTEQPGFPPQVGDEEKNKYIQLFKKALTAGIYLPPSPYEVAFISTAHSHSVLDEVIQKLDS